MSVASVHAGRLRLPFPLTRIYFVFSALALTVALHLPAALRLHQLWVDDDNATYTHGYPVAGACAILATPDYQDVAAHSP